MTNTFNWEQSADLTVDGDPVPTGIGLAGGGFAGSLATGPLRQMVQDFLNLPFDRQTRARIRYAGKNLDPAAIYKLSKLPDF